MPTLSEEEAARVKRWQQLLYGIVFGIFVLNVVLFLVHSRSSEKDKASSRPAQSAGTATVSTQANGSTH